MLLCNYRDVIMKLQRCYYVIMAPSHLFLAVINYSGRNAHCFIFMHILLILYFLFNGIYHLTLEKNAT